MFKLDFFMIIFVLSDNLLFLLSVEKIFKFNEERYFQREINLYIKNNTYIKNFDNDFEGFKKYITWVSRLGMNFTKQLKNEK